MVELDDYSQIPPRARLGFIIPSSNRMVEPQIQQYCPEGVVPHFNRIGMTNRHKAPLEVLKPRIVEAAELLADSKVDVTVLQCTGTSMSGGVDPEKEIIRAMAQALKARGGSFELHYSSRTPADMAYRDQLAIEFPEQLQLYFTRADGGMRFDLQSAMRSAPADALFYVCGPGRLIVAAGESAHELGIAAGRLQYENFE